MPQICERKMRRDGNPLYAPLDQPKNHRTPCAGGTAAGDGIRPKRQDEVRGCCGTPYRRVTWIQRGQKRIVWRCINRLDYGTKYCKKSPTLEEGAIQNAIVRAITGLAFIEPMIFENLKLHMEMGMQDTPDESAALRLRLNELNSALVELVIANTSDGADNTAEEILALAGKLKGHPVEYDEKTVRQLLECVKVVDSETLLIIFRGGIEKEVRIG